MKKRELKRSIIRMVRNREMYGYEMRGLLASQGEKIQLSYLYKTLKEMCEEGLLQSRRRAGEHGPQRRQYHLTEQGSKELGKIFGEATELIHDFYEDYAANLPPRFFLEKFQMMIREMYGGRDVVAMLISEPLAHVQHRKILEELCGRPGAKRTYLIKPAHFKSDTELPNLTVLDGDFEDIPLKEKSLDAIMVVDIQDAENLRTSCKEFRRVLKSGGIMCGCAPFMGLGGANDPLEVGEFMKKMKRSLTGEDYLDKETIKKALRETFDYVDIANMSFLTAFISGLKPIRVTSR